MPSAERRSTARREAESLNERIRRFLDRGVFLNFLLSYLLVLLLPLGIVGGVVYWRLLQQIEGKVRAANHVMLRQASRVMDLRIQELGLLAGQISLNPRVRDFLFQPGTGPAETVKIMNLLSEMGVFQAPNRFLDKLAVYSFRADAIVTRDALYTPDFFYAHICRPDAMDFGRWRRQMHEEHFGTVSAGTYYLEARGVWDRYLTYLQSLPTNEGAPAGTMVAFIGSDQVGELFAPLVAGSGGVAFVIDASGRPLAATGSVPAGEWRFISDEGATQRRIGGETMVVSHVKSEVTGWSYVSLIPARVCYAEVHAVRRFLLFVLALCLLLGLGTAAIMSWRNYRPIRAILDVLRPSRAAGQRREGDELAQIMESARQAMYENRHLQAFMEQNEGLIRGNMLRLLLFGRVTGQEREEILEKLGYPPESAYAVLALDIETVAAAGGIVALAAAKAIQERFGLPVAEWEDGRLGVLLALKSGGDAEAAALSASREIQNHLDRGFQIPASVGFSLAQECGDIPRAFREAVQAADYRIVGGRSAITSYARIARADDSYYYPLDVERQLINHVKAGDGEAAAAVVDEICDENFNRRCLPVNLVRCVFFDLMGTAMKVLQELNIAGDQVLGSEPVEQVLARVDTAMGMRGELKRIFGLICRWITERHESHNTSLRQEVLAMLEAGFGDPNLTLALVAEGVNVSSSYLSRFFKDQTGYNFADYLNRLRIERAKALLSDHRLTLNEIAGSVGYLSANTLIRIFKKYEGVTPGQYREGEAG